MEGIQKDALQSTCKKIAKRTQISVAPSRIIETRAAKKARLNSLPPPIVTPETPSSSAPINGPATYLLSPPISNKSPTYSSTTESGLKVEKSVFPITPATFARNSAVVSSDLPSISTFSETTTQRSLFDCTDVNLSLTSHVGQNFDGTWFISDSVASLGHVSYEFGTTLKLKNSSKPAFAPIQDGKIIDDQSEYLQRTSQRRCNTKRKADDDELSFQEVLSNPDSMEGEEELHQKREFRRKKPNRAGKTRPKTPKLPLYHENVQDGKPDPFGFPEVWAFKRQQLCETLPYYNAYQSGAYTQDGIARAILIDKEVSIRDIFDDEIIITSV